MGIDFDVLVDDGLANNSYLLDLGDGWALAVDASRALRALRDRARHRGLRVAVAADTHLHADFLSGAPELGAAGATVRAAAADRRPPRLPPPGPVRRGRSGPGSRHIELGDPRRRAGARAGPVVVMCGHGERAGSAASRLERAGRHGVRILAGGPADWAGATGPRLQTGP